MIKTLALDERLLKKISRYRGGFFLPFMAFMFLYRWNEYENDTVIWTVGPFLLLASLSIRIWATAHIGKRIPKWLRTGHEKTVVTTGPYSIVRNPLYIANIIATLGISVLFELLWLLPVTFLYSFAVYSVTVRYEEERLSRTFGDTYATYKKQVPRWFPRVSGFRREIRSFPWSHVMLGESRSCLLGIFVLSLGILKESFF